MFIYVLRMLSPKIKCKAQISNMVCVGALIYGVQMHVMEINNAMIKIMHGVKICFYPMSLVVTHGIII